MALILQHSRFLHTPKTGGIWVNHAVQKSGICHAHIGEELEHLNLHGCPGNGLFTIAFVREPWSWWKSYFVFKQQAGWSPELEIDRLCQSSCFETFLKNVLEHCPGYCSQVMRLYAGAPGREIDYVARFENLVDELVSALQTAGEKFDENAVRETPPVNTGNYVKYDTGCSCELRNRILESEREAVLRFGYEQVSHM